MRSVVSVLVGRVGRVPMPPRRSAPALASFASCALRSDANRCRSRQYGVGADDATDDAKRSSGDANCGRRGFALSIDDRQLKVDSRRTYVESIASYATTLVATGQEVEFAEKPFSGAFDDAAPPETTRVF